jgi:hypothetical protein
MLDHGYFFRQIRILLKFARLTSDPLFAALLLEKAAKLKSQAEGIPRPSDMSPLPPDMEPVKTQDSSGADIDGKFDLRV